MKKLRKFLTIGVMVLSIIAMSGLTVAPASAAAQAGDLIKMDGLSSVYYLGNDGKRYVFPSESVYFSWYNDFSRVVTIPASELQSYPLGANVTMRPGTKLVKITTDPSVYAVTPNGVLRKIQSEADAIALYGSNWNKIIVDVADSFFTNYTIGSPLTSGTYPAGTLLKNPNNASIYYFDGTNYRLIATEAAFNANRFSFNNVVTTSTAITASGSTITGAESFSAPSGGVGSPITGSGLTVSLSATTPASMTIPTGTPANFLAFNLTAANDGAVNVSTIKLTAYELGDSTNIDEVSIFDNGVKVGTSKNINSDKEAIFSFATPIYVAAGTTKTLTVKATAAAAGDYALGIAKASDVVASAGTVSGSYPVRGNKMTAVVSSNVGTLEITNTPDTTNSTVDFGDDDVVMASFNLKANNEDALVTSMKFKNGGTNVSDIVSNLKLLIDGTEVATGTYTDGYATFALNNYKIEKGDTVTVEVRGDMGTTNVNDTFTLYLKDRADIVAVGASYGYQVQLDTTSFAKLDTVAEGMTLTLAASDFTIDADKAATPAKDIKANTNDVVLATLKMKSNGENATLEGISGAGNFTIVGNALLANEVKNVRMVDISSGATYDLNETFSTDHYLLTLSDEITFIKGVTKTFQVKADVDSTADVNDTLKVHLEADGMTVTGDVSNATINDITPTEVNGSIMTVKASTMSWNVTTLNNTTVVAGASDVVVYQGKIKPNAIDAVKLNSLKLTTTANNMTAFSDNNITRLDLYVNGVLVKTVSNNIVEATAGTKGSITFTSLANHTLAANTEVDVMVKASFSSTLSGNAFNLEAAAGSDIVAKTIVGNDNVTINGGITGGARTVTVATVGTLMIDLVTTDVNASADQYLLAGATSFNKYLGELKFTTANEPVRVKTLTLTSSGTDVAADINVVRLVKADGTVVASKTVESTGNVVFDPLDLVFEADKTTSLFISTLARGINVENDPTSTATQGHTVIYTLGAGAAITAEGVNSGEAVTIAANNDATLAAGEWDDDDSTKTHTITGVKLNSVVNSMNSGTLVSGQQELGRYTLTFEHGNNRNTSNEAYLAQLEYFKVTIAESGATTTNLTLRVDGTQTEVADSATQGIWTDVELANLLNAGKINDVTTLVISGSVAIDPAANNYSVQTRIADLNGTGNDDIRHNGLTNMYLPYTGVTGANLHN